MSREFRCPLGHAMRIPEDYAGKPLRCPICYQIVTVPRDAATPSPHPTGPAAMGPTASASAAMPSTSETVPSAGTDDTLFPPLRRTVARARPHRLDANYRAIVHAVALGMFLLALLQTLPIVQTWNADSRPAWVWSLLLFVAAQAAYALWLAIIPHWSTVRVAMIALAAVASLYSALAAIVICTPRSNALLLGLDDVREPARLWCTVVMVLATIVAFAAGHASFAWRRHDERRRLVEQNVT